jgi:heme exporter protein C
MSIPRGKTTWVWALPGLMLVGLMLIVNCAVTLVAPTDIGMGDAQRILYVHVSVAWLSLISFVVMAAGGIQYLRQRDLAWDAWSQAAGEIGWLCCSLTLFSGCMWAHEAWGTWWTWDPRLTTVFVLWLFYSGCWIVREGITDMHRRARICAVLATLGVLDVPLVTMATRWFRGIHPVSPRMEPTMRLALLITALSFTAFFAVTLVQRRKQLRLKYILIDSLRISEIGDLSATPTQDVSNGII